MNAVEVCKSVTSVRAGPRVLSANATRRQAGPEDAPCIQPRRLARMKQKKKRDSLASFKGNQGTCRLAWVGSGAATGSGLVPPLQLRERPLPYYGALGRDRSLSRCCRLSTGAC